MNNLGFLVNAMAEVIQMKKYTDAVIAAGFILAVLISQCFSIVEDGRTLEQLRSGVLRLHILAASDSERDQELKLKVRDELLKSRLFEEVHSLEEVEMCVENRLNDIEVVAESILRRNGSSDRVRAYLTDMYFGERIYGDITMPKGNYRALRIEIGEACGHNWWCVMYPPLCLPAACEVTDDKEKEEELFTEKELDILHKPEKYQVRFAIWDKIHEIKESTVVHDDEILLTTDQLLDNMREAYYNYMENKAEHTVLTVRQRRNGQ